MNLSLAFAILFGICPSLGVQAFAFAGTNQRRRVSRPAFFATLAPEDASATTATLPPSWDDLSETLEVSSQATKEEDEREPVLTLYRDTNGWCPFCERVWLAIRAKNLPYNEQLINLRDKPDWYKALVPTTLVPAVLFHGDGSSPERSIVWESIDVLQALDDKFPDTTQLVWDTPEYQQAQEVVDNLSTRGFGYLYASRNATLTAEDKEELRAQFIKALDRLEAFLGEMGGPYCLGSDFSGMDCIMVPQLERWRHQLPTSSANMDLLENRPHLEKWFEAMDAFAPYSERVAGDAYSWTAVSAVFLRYFGGEENAEMQQAIERVDLASSKLIESFATATVDERFAAEAATKLISNHEAIVKDCTNPEPMSQQNVPRATNANVADVALRYVASLLLDPSPFEAAKTTPLVQEISKEDIPEASQALRTVAARLCVPRDMGAPAAKVLRKVLATVADRLEAEL